MDNEKICKNCKYWRGRIYSNGSDSPGPCELITLDGDSFTEIGVQTEYFEFIEHAWVDTDALFGCVRWEEWD